MAPALRAWRVDGSPAIKETNRILTAIINDRTCPLDYDVAKRSIGLPPSAEAR